MEGHWCYSSNGHGAQAICYIPLSVSNIPSLNHNTVYQCTDSHRAFGETEMYIDAPALTIEQYRLEYCALKDGLWIYNGAVAKTTETVDNKHDTTGATDTNVAITGAIDNTSTTPAPADASSVATSTTYIARLMSWIYPYASK